MPIVRRATLVTPNLAEAAMLSGMAVVCSLDQAKEAAARICAAGARAVLIKGGHLEGDPTDVLLAGGAIRVWRSPRVPGPNPRGTGCALATAIAVGLARGNCLDDAIGAARSWLVEQIAAARAVGDEYHLPGAT